MEIHINLKNLLKELIYVKGNIFNNPPILRISCSPDKACITEPSP